MPPVADDSLDSFLLQQMGDPCTVVSGVQAHILRQLSKARLDFVEDFGDRGDVVDIGGLNVDVDDDVALAVHRPVFAVMEPVRLPSRPAPPCTPSVVCSTVRLNI